MGSNPIICIITIFGNITQLVECMLCMHKVIGSNPIISNKNDITQLVEYWNHNPFVMGSNPVFVR